MVAEITTNILHSQWHRLRRFSERDPPKVHSTLTIGTVASLRPEKNLTRLIYAFHKTSRHVDCRLIIVGDGPERHRLDALVARLGLTSVVHFAGQVENPAPMYREMDVFALSSDTEQMPYTVIEAMAAGLPVVATDVGDIAQMVTLDNLPYVVHADLRRFRPLFSAFCGI